MGEFLDSLARYATLDACTLVLPSHGLPFQGLHARVSALREHHRVRLERVTQACGVTQGPQRAVDVLPVLFDRTFDDHHLLFAMGEAIAHLNALWLQGDLHRELGADGVYRFRPA